MRHSVTSCISTAIKVLLSVEPTGDSEENILVVDFGHDVATRRHPDAIADLVGVVEPFGRRIVPDGVQIPLMRADLPLRISSRID